MTSPIRRETHHGIAVAVVDVPGPFTGTLTFDVGHRDEPAELGGITHLAEHLVLRSAGEVTAMHDGVTNISTVEFVFWGSPDEVAEGLNRVAAVLVEPGFSDADLDFERRIIEAEDPGATSTSRGLLTVRFGLAGIGGADAGRPALCSITVGEVHDWIRQWFVAQNARLSFTGDVPAGLDVRLREGSPPEHLPAPAQASAPLLVPSPKAGVALSLVVEVDSAPFVRDIVTQELTRALRDERGLIYGVDADVAVLDHHHAVAGWVLDPVDDVAETATGAVRQLRRVAEIGPSAHSLAVARSRARTILSQPQAWLDHADSAAAHWRPATVLDPDAMVALTESLSALDIAGRVATSMESLIVMVDRDELDPEAVADELGLPIEDPRLGEPASAGRGGPGRLWWGAFGSALRNWCRLDGSVLWWREDGPVRRVDLARIALAGRFADGALCLVDDRGRGDVLLPPLWVRGHRLVEAVVDVLPVEVRDFSWHDGRPPRPPVSSVSSAHPTRS